MWLTTVLFGLMVNFEPNRLGLICLFLTRKRPIAHLTLFLATGSMISGATGLLVLSVFHHQLSGLVSVNGPIFQLGIGVVILVIATVLAIKPSVLPNPFRLASAWENEEVALAGAARRPRVDQLAGRIRSVAQSESRWLPALIGAAMALPSAEYMAVLTVIIGSGSPLASQIAALLTCLTLGSLAVLISIGSCLVAPEATREKVRRLTVWIRARQRREVVVVLTVIGAALVVAGAIAL
ncbi:hypothetical protein BOH72_08225 [Mycobacterium sp. WY10]|nr:hypothetical protein BOH72_08225 [Mycobacterium sp. WY10]